jgi:hypothetical protein
MLHHIPLPPGYTIPMLSYQVFRKQEPSDKAPPIEVPTIITESPRLFPIINASLTSSINFCAVKCRIHQACLYHVPATLPNIDLLQNIPQVHGGQDFPPYYWLQIHGYRRLNKGFCFCLMLSAQMIFASFPGFRPNYRVAFCLDQCLQFSHSSRNSWIITG